MSLLAALTSCHSEKIISLEGENLLEGGQLLSYQKLKMSNFHHVAGFTDCITFNMDVFMSNSIKGKLFYFVQLEIVLLL